MEKLGGRKFILSAVALAVMLAVFLILALKGTLSDGIAAILGGIVTAILTQYGVTNVAAKRTDVPAPTVYPAPPATVSVPSVL